MSGRRRPDRRPVGRRPAERQPLGPQSLAELATFGTVAAFAVLPWLQRREGECRIAARIGRPCPLCGGTRALVALRRGDVGGAVRSNLMVTAAALLGTAMLPVVVEHRAG